MYPFLVRVCGPIDRLPQHPIRAIHSRCAPLLGHVFPSLPRSAPSLPNHILSFASLFLDIVTDPSSPLA